MVLRLAGLLVLIVPVLVVEPQSAVSQGPKNPAKQVKPHTDALGDPLPAGAVARLGTTRLVHAAYRGAPVRAVFSPDGRVIASAFGEVANYDPPERAVHFWDAATGKEAPPFRLPGLRGVSALAFSPDGTLLAVGAECAGADDLLLVDVRTAKLLRRFGPHEIGALAARFVDGGKTLVSVSGPGGKVCWWDVATGKQLRNWDAARLWPKKTGRRQLIQFCGAALSPDGTVLAANGQWATGKGSPLQDRWELVVLDLKAGKELWRAKGPREHASPTAFSPDGKRLALDLPGTEPAVHETATGKLLWRMPKLKGEEDDLPECGVAFAGDGKTLAVGIPNIGVQLWDVDAGRCLKMLRPPLTPSFFAVRMAVSPDGKRVLAAARNRLWLWDTATGAMIPQADSHGGHVTALHFFADGKELVSAERYSSIFCEEYLRWDTRTWRLRERRDWKALESSRFTLRSPDYRLRLCLADDTGEWTVHAGDAAKALCKLELKPKAKEPVWGSISPNNRLAVMNAAAQEPGKLWLLDLTTGKRRCSLPDDATDLCFAFSPTDRAISWFHKDGTLRVTDAVTGRERWRFGEAEEFAGNHPRPTLAYSADGRYLASWRWQRHEEEGRHEIHVWDTATGKEHCRLVCRRTPMYIERSPCLAISPDSRTLAVGGLSDEPVVQVWELATAKLRRTLRGHRGPVTALAFAPDSRLLASGSEDTTVLIWDLFAPPGN